MAERVPMKEFEAVVAAWHTRGDALERFLRIVKEIGQSPVEYDGARNYVTVQVDRDTWCEIQQNVPHTHKAGLGDKIDTCGKCGCDIRHPIHLVMCSRCKQEMESGSYPDGCRDPDCPMLEQNF